MISDQDSGQPVLSLKDVLGLAWHYRYLIAGSLVFCLFLGALYLARTSSVYQNRAALIIRSDERGQMDIAELSTFQDIGLFGGSINVNNEIEAFKSPVLMAEVVGRLGLNVSYVSSNWIGRKTDLYTSSPLHAVFPDAGDDSRFSFTVTPVDSLHVRLSDFKLGQAGGDDIELDVSPLEYRLLDTLETPVGRVILSPTFYFNAEYWTGRDKIRVSYGRLRSMVDACLKKLTVTLANKDASVVNLGYQDVSAARGVDVLNTLVDVYNEDWIRYTNESTTNTSRFINERLVIIEKELSMVDTEVESFKSENRLVDLEKQAELVTTESQEYAEKSFELNNQLSIARYVLEYMGDQSKQNDLLPANSGIENTNIEGLISEYNEMLLKRNRLVVNSSDRNPLVADLNEALTMLRQTVLRSLNNLISTLELQVKHITEQEDQIAERISASPTKERELLSIERRKTITEQLYLYLLQKREENEMRASVTINNTRILTPAMTELAPVSPKGMMVLLVALVLGFALPCGWIWLRVMLHGSTVNSRSDLSSLSVPFLGEIPQDGKPVSWWRRWLRRHTQKGRDEESAPKVAVKEKNRNPVNEAFRIVRTNIDLMGLPEGKGRVFIFSSFYPGSGKTFVTMNLALCMAFKGKRIIVVDMDLRKASLSRYVDSPKKGVASYLNGHEASWEGLLVKGSLHADVDVLPVGALPPNPAELLVNGRFEQLLSELKEAYDYVFIDSTPLEMIADTALVVRHADLNFFVMRADLFERRYLPEVEKLYREKRLPNMALLLNGVLLHSGSHYGYGHYGYGYGYGYGMEEGHGS